LVEDDNPLGPLDGMGLLTLEVKQLSSREPADEFIRVEGKLDWE
jgi:hypothetical protein